MKIALSWLVLLLMPVIACGQQWETYRFDHGRTGRTETRLSVTSLELAWQWESPMLPNPAWDGPARWDAFAKIRDLPAMRQYDACFHPVSDGESVFFGSSSQDILYALSLSNGQVQWTFVAGAPIRLAPTIDGDRVLFGCDDGYAYCLDRKSGSLIWKFSPSKHLGSDQRQLINNDRLISYFPIRTGITVRDGLAYFGASFLPWRESMICAIDVKSGNVDKSGNTFVTPLADATLEGNMLVTNDRLIVPQGRIAPRLYDRRQGKDLGSLPGGGGVTIVLTESGEVLRAEGGRASRPGHVGVYQGKERIASFPRGRAMVVSDDDFFVIDGQKLFAAGKLTNELKWTRDVDEPLELIMAGDTLLVGGRDHVTAVDSHDGTVVWTAPVEGRVFGLAVAGGRLIASTDAGIVYAFAPTLETSEAPVLAQPKPWESQMVPPVRKQDLQHRWVFHRSTMSDRLGAPVESLKLTEVVVKDQVSNLDLKLAGDAEAIHVNGTAGLEAIGMQGDAYFPIESERIEELPTDAISVETWVRVDEALQWGGIVGCVQDDGAVEHGWLLGYRNEQFCFALAGGKRGLTYLTAPQSFQLKSWNHVVGTYDGTEMRLYVNGSLVATSELESGAISYAKQKYFTVGAYRDANESYPLHGAIHEIRVSSRVIPATEVSQSYEAAVGKFGIQSLEKDGASGVVSWGPVARFVNLGEVEITYGTNEEGPTVVDLIDDQQVKRYSNAAKVDSHKIRLKGLPAKRILQYQILKTNEKGSPVSNSYALDTHFDWSPSKPLPPSQPIKELLEASSNPRGLAIVVGADRAAFAKKLSLESQFHVVLAVNHDSVANELRNKWLTDSEVVYGSKLNICAVPLSELPAACAAVVVSGRKEAQVRRLVRPAGGILHDGKSLVWTRRDIKGAGVWSHMYGRADNSAFGGEELSNASERSDLITQWIGRPGPRYQTDRQNRKPSPLAVGGRMYLQGQQRMIALDAYSGTVLWSVETPTVMRWNVPHDCSNWCADKAGIFVAAEEQAWFVSGRDGQIERRFQLPIDDASNSGKHWGYISCYQGQLLGTVVEAEAIYTKWWGKTQWFDSTGGNDTHVVAAEQLFSMDANTGALQWKYEGLVLHPTITIQGGRIFFVQDKTEAHLKSPQRRISLEKDQDHELVCLDAVTGAMIWSRPLSKFQGHIASLYLAAGGEKENRCLVSVASESTRQSFAVEAFDLLTGKTKWQQTVNWEANHHGKHISRPAMQGELMYLRPEVLSLADGASIHRGFPGGHGCASYTLSANGLFARLGETTWWDVRTQKVNRFDRIRTDCWISLVPAQGMLLSAEGGGGCSCGTWLETSLGFLPRSVDEELPEQ